MQLAKCTVKLGGDLKNTVIKYNVTPAEILLLKAIHGDDAVVGVEATGGDKREHAAERARLLANYGRAKDSQDQSIFDRVFPGATSLRLPVALSDIGIPVAYTESDESADKPGDTTGKPAAPAPTAPANTPSNAPANSPAKH
jgi:hypothetical protein